MCIQGSGSREPRGPIIAPGTKNTQRQRLVSALFLLTHRVVTASPFVPVRSQRHPWLSVCFLFGSTITERNPNVKVFFGFFIRRSPDDPGVFHNVR